MFSLGGRKDGLAEEEDYGRGCMRRNDLTSGSCILLVLESASWALLLLYQK